LSSVLIWGSTWFASIGNIISARNQRSGIPVVQTNAWGMAYGALLFPVIALGISTVFEDYQWTLHALFGFALLLLGTHRVDARRQAGRIVASHRVSRFR
jgi:hypothetical protein